MKKSKKTFLAIIQMIIRKAVRRELARIFRREGDVAVDVHMKSHSWAVIKLDVPPSEERRKKGMPAEGNACYLKFYDLPSSSIRDIQNFLRQFDCPAKIDAPRDVQHYLGGYELF